jgi:hypothetical protein
MEKNFIEDSEKHYFVFTDSPEIDFEKENSRIHRIYQKNLGWPDNTLKRFHIFLSIENQLTNMDYLFFFNANLVILEKINKEEFLPINNKNLVATLHPGFYNKKRKKFTYENNKKSTAYIEKSQGENYFAGGLNGGKASNFLEAMKTMHDNTDIDTKNNVIAKWHDESHWNKYLINRIDIKILPSSYLYPEGWQLPFKPIILIRDKNKYGGHSLLRNDKLNPSKSYLLIIKKLISKLFIIVKSIFKKPYILQKVSCSNLSNFNLENINLLITTISMNNLEVIKYQHLYLNKNINEEFSYLVADNSNQENISKEIYDYCNRNKILYIKLPNDNFPSNPSKSHGSAINWVYKNTIESIKPKFFGFIDHDIFPYKETSITPFVQQGIFGLTQERNEKWYLWAGFCFYEYDIIKKYKLNFMPCSGLDTGGSNYYSLYRNIEKDKLYKIKQKYLDIDKKVEIKEITDINKTVEVLEDWVHLMRTSNWNNQINEKMSKIDDIINMAREIK